MFKETCRDNVSVSSIAGSSNSYTVVCDVGVCGKICRCKCERYVCTASCGLDCVCASA